MAWTDLIQDLGDGEGLETDALAQVRQTAGCQAQHRMQEIGNRSAAGSLVVCCAGLLTRLAERRWNVKVCRQLQLRCTGTSAS